MNELKDQDVDALIADPAVSESERAIMVAVRAALAGLDQTRVWRNNVGVDLARGVRYGLAVGSGDLIGLSRGRFISLEVKRPGGRPSYDQKAWQRVVRRLGGVAEIVTSTDEALDVVDAIKRGRI